MSTFMKMLNNAIDTVGDYIGTSNYAKSRKLVHEFTAIELSRETHNAHIAKGLLPVNLDLEAHEYPVIMKLCPAENFDRAEYVTLLTKQMKLKVS